MANLDKRRGVWVARMKWRGERQYLGEFPTEAEAAQVEREARETWNAYDAWEKEFVSET